MRTERSVEKCVKWFEFECECANTRCFIFAVCCAKRKTVLKSHLRVFVAVHVNALRFLFLSFFFFVVVISFEKAWKAVSVKAERKWKKKCTSIQCTLFSRSARRCRQRAKWRYTYTRHTHGKRWKWNKNEKNEIIRVCTNYTAEHISQTYTFLFWFKIPSAYYDAFYVYMFYEESARKTQRRTGKRNSKYEMRSQALHTHSLPFLRKSCVHTLETSYVWICAFILRIKHERITKEQTLSDSYYSKCDVLRDSYTFTWGLKTSDHLFHPVNSRKTIMPGIIRALWLSIDSAIQQSYCSRRPWKNRNMFDGRKKCCSIDNNGNDCGDCDCCSSYHIDIHLQSLISVFTQWQ